MNDIYLPYKNPTYRNIATYQKYFFIIFAIFGFIFIWITKIVGIPQVVVTLTVVSLIPIYCFITYKNASFGLREDQIGDNAYYLGFLYTLSSLSFALWKFSSQNVGTEIVSSFGVALWSTIAGVALRVLFSQMYKDSNEIESDARARIAQTADMLVVELNQACAAFNTYRRNLGQSLEEAFEDMNKSASENFNEFKDNSKKLNNSSEKIINAIESLHQKIATISAPKDIITSKIDNIFKDTEESSRKFSSYSLDQLKSTELIIQGTEALIKNIETLNYNISMIQKSYSTTSEGLKNLDELSHKIQKLGGFLTSFSDNLELLLSKQKEATAGISKHADELEKQLTRSREYTEATHASIMSMVKTLDQKLQ